MRTFRVLGLLSPFTLLLISTGLVKARDEPYDVREGEDVTLKCRFNLGSTPIEALTLYWVRVTSVAHDNVAIGSVPLETNYKVLYAPKTEGRFDLMISNVSYERDHGWFNCRVKEGGSGHTVHSQSYDLTVLTPPKPPSLSHGSQVQAQEGRELNLTCSSTGGSPEPVIKWYREGSTYALDTTTSHAKIRSEATTATLTLTPTKDDDGSIFKCVVWNRAMPEGQQLDTAVELSVHYFPRVEVGPTNPLQVEIDSSATMECKVDAKPRVNSVRWTRNGKFISNSFIHTIQGVSVDDAGDYVCTADNGLGHPGEKQLYLDVLYPPTVTVPSKTHEAEEGGNVEIRCNVSANPEPTIIEWTMEGEKDFRQSGNTLILTRINADMAGTYTCRAVNIIPSASSKRLERSSSTSVAVLVRHKPGRAYITPSHPIVVEGKSITLTCHANPPGWPVPQYRWYRNLNVSDESKMVALVSGKNLTVSSANLGSETDYSCQATNELGHSELATASLEVHQPPTFQSKLPAHLVERAGHQDFSVSCSAYGKPLPEIRWFKNKTQITPDSDLFEIKNDITEGSQSVYYVQTTLKFRGKERPNSNELLPEDRGLYLCVFENTVRNTNASLYLRIQHEPILIRLQNKVAYDVSETAAISCRALAFPKPEFQWFYGTNTSPLASSSNGHYDIDTTTDNNDSYLSVLRIKSVQSQDYGDYYCQVKNTLGYIKPQIRLQPKGAPEPPQALENEEVGSNYIMLKWKAGFDGGLSNKYFVAFRKVSEKNNDGHCAGDSAFELDWMEYECGRANPCNVTHLNQHKTYFFKVKAVNTKGQSNYSNEIMVTTKVDKISAPEQVTYDPSSRTMTFTVSPTCLPLVGVVEGFLNAGGVNGWQVVETIPLRLSGSAPTVQEASVELPTRGARREGPPDAPPRLRLKLCLQLNQDICSVNTDAEIGTASVRESSPLKKATTIAILVSCLVFLVFLGLLFIFCRCKRKENKKNRAKDYEMDSISAPKVSPQHQAPPPYYPSAGMENKALEHSMDLALTLDDSKNTMYATQGGYAYHVSPHAPAHPPQNVPNSDWANIGYVENSYPNSNNGGSVNSQDSLWPMKMAALPAGYEYEGAFRDEYAPYAHVPPVGEYRDRQDYCSDPYASVHKPKKRMDQHMESPYHEVSGLPEYGAGEAEGGAEEKPPHLSLSYDESLESGYSTPNSRARRVIREIIV